MEKSIIIKTSEVGASTFEASGYNEMEILGILRYYEKQVWLSMTNKAAQQAKQEAEKAKTEAVVILGSINPSEKPN